jgi:endonuclease/exonuclease/phosphatase (EEP) superfamily protein YafD
MMTLDYIFHSPELRTLDFKVPRVRLSDHAPLIWEFEIDRIQQPVHPPQESPEFWI